MDNISNIGRKSIGKAGGLLFMVLAFSWLRVGISEFDWEFQLSMAKSYSGDGTVTELTVTSTFESEPEEESN